MARGTNQSAITTNDLLIEYSRDLERRVEEQAPWDPLFRKLDKPAGIDSRMNFVVATDADGMDRQAPLTPRQSRERSGYEIFVDIPDKERHSRAVSWEKIRKGRFDEAKEAVHAVEQAIVIERATNQGDYILTNAVTNGSPADPTAAASGETAYWWNTNDTVAPAKYGNITFSAGHDHVETGVTAMTMDRIRVWRKHITEHGYGKTGMVGFLGEQENSTLLNLANVAWQTRTTGNALTDDFQKAGTAAEVNGFMGMMWIVNAWVPNGTVGIVDRNLASLGANGGAVRLVEQDVVTNQSDDDDIQATWFEGWYQEGYGILHKAAGYTARCA